MALIPGGTAEFGAFFAGVSISALPYKLQIEAKVESLKSLGIVLFFFIFGINLHLTVDKLKAAAPMALTISLLTVFVLPLLMWLLGLVSGVDGRTAFMMSGIINQVFSPSPLYPSPLYPSPS